MSGRIAVNLLWLLPGKVGGSEEYLIRQLHGLADVDPSVALTLFVQPSFADHHPDVVERFPTVISPTLGDSRARRIAAESSWLHSMTATAALVHHGGGAAPIRSRRPYVLTLHDLQYRTFPQYFSAAKRAWFDAVLPRSVRRASIVAVPTQFVRSTVLDSWDIEPDRVCVVPHGFDPPAASRATPEDELRSRYRLGDARVLVYPAVTHPHKQHRLLVELMEHIWPDPDLLMVFIGGVGLAEDDTVSDDARIRRLGRVSDADRDGLLRMAEAMVFPSSYEGFGAPLVEAMALGCPVVCSDATCIPEVVGDAAVVRPLDAEAWADALDVVARERNELIARGRARAARFTAAQSGSTLAECYRRGLA
jgi:glycosyltransferase involved in cell wall biosynthesis